MPTIPLFVKLILGTIAAAAGVLAGILGNVLAINIVYRITKRGRKPTARPPIVWVLFCLSTAAFVILGTLVALAPLPPERDGASTEVDGKSIIVRIEGQHDNIIAVFDRQGSPLWQVDVDTGVREATVDDIDQDGYLEVIAATHEPGARPGWLLAFDEAGNLLDEYNTWKPSIYRGGAKPKMNVSDFQITDLTNDGTKEIVAVSRDVYWYVSRLSVLQFQGGRFGEVAEYWNPGLLYTLHIGDTDGDQIQEVVCIGENNDLQSVLPLGGNVYVAFSLDGSSISGQAPPWFGDASKGSEIWYGYAVPSSVSVREVDFEDVDEDGIPEIHVALSDNCSCYLDHDGNIVGWGRGSGCKFESDFQVFQDGE
jgi:hypothetical protein